MITHWQTLIYSITFYIYQHNLKYHHDKVAEITGNTVLVAIELLLNNVILGVKVRWSIRNAEHYGKVSNQHISNKQFKCVFFITFGFVRSSEVDLRAVVDMEYVTSDELGDFVRLRFVLGVYFTYVVQVRSNVNILPYF